MPPIEQTYLALYSKLQMFLHEIMAWMVLNRLIYQHLLLPYRYILQALPRPGWLVRRLEGEMRFVRVLMLMAM